MNKLSNRIRQITFNLKRDFFTLENVILVGALVMFLVLMYQSVVYMSRNWELSERLTAERKELELLTLEVESAELENQYYASEEYQELMARRNLDKKFPGENMVILPENSTEAKEKYKIDTASTQEKTYSNFEKWKMFLFPTY